MLHLMYNMSAFEALRYCQFVHDLRRIPINVGSPQTQMQRDQVIRVIEFLTKEAKREREESVKRARARASRRAANAAANSGGGNDNAPPKALPQPDLSIQNGSNVIEVVAVSAPATSSLTSAGSARQAANNGKKSLRQMREANRAAAQRTTNAQGNKASSGPQKQGDDNMIAGLTIGTIKIPTAAPNVEEGNTTPLPKMEPAPTSSTVDLTQAKSSKVDEIMQASPVANKQPVPPSGGSSRKGKGPRAGNRVK
jgi:hypothetical protein